MKSVALVLGLSLTITAGLSAATLDGEVVSDPSGTAIPNARITLFTPPLDFFQETRSDSSGQWTLLNIPPGTYQLGVSARDFEYAEVSVSVSAAPLSFTSELAPETNQGSWSVIGSTLPEFLDATDIAYLTPQGQVFLCHNTTDPILFDPVTGAKTFPSGSGSEQGCMNGTVLGDARLLLVGGQDGSDPGSFMDAVRWVKTWSPAQSWVQLADLVHPVGRWYTGLARLADGSVMAMGGGTAPSAVRTDTCERFDLVTETWSYTGSMLNPCEFPPSALLHTGEVLITWSPPQLYDPVLETWQATGDFVQPNRGWPGHSDHSIVVLADGSVLAIGTRSTDLPSPAMGELYDPQLGSWSVTSNPGLVRQQPEVVQLPDGRVFVGAGQAKDPIPVPDVLGRVLWTDIYDPETDAWRRVADMQHFREYHAVTLLVPDGRVITTGGTVIDFIVGPTSADIEAYSPPYLFRGVRPQISSISTTTPGRGDTVTFDVFPQTEITSVVLMGTEVVTHWVSGGIPRRLELDVTQTGNQASVALPTDTNVLPLGWYMLFAMVDDIPSVAQIVNVVDTSPVPFVRSECNADAAVDLADAIRILDFVFGSGPPLDCQDACDANDDGDLDISDPIFLLAYLFDGGISLPPFPLCGGDPTQDALGCDTYAICP